MSTVLPCVFISSSPDVQAFIEPVRKAVEKWKGGMEMQFILKVKMVIVHCLWGYVCNVGREVG